MAKRLFLFTISIFISWLGLANNFSTFLSAAENIEASGVDFSSAVETVISEPETTVVAEQVKPASTPVKAPATATAARSTTPAGNYIQIAGKTLSITDVTSTAVDSGTHVNKYGDKFLYGHNSSTVFGGLKNLAVGSSFSVNYGGQSANYQIQKIVIFEKNVTAGTLELNGSGTYMRSVANAKFQGIQYDLSIMTCSGTSYGNGDASHRLVIFANRV